MIPDKKRLLTKITNNFQLSTLSPHGMPHWGRVKTNGFRIAKYTEGVDLDVVELFVYLHDSCRINESYDPEHGMRAVTFAESLRGEFFTFTSAEFELFAYACVSHTSGLVEADVTVQCCWNADRLDLGRVGIMPHPNKLCTDYAKRPDVIEWAMARSR
jgi:uncharacterized protein